MADTRSLLQRSAAWFKARQGRLTASSMGALLGLAKAPSRAQAYKRLIGEDKFVGNAATEWGTSNEINALIDYQCTTGNEVEQTGLWLHGCYTWIAGSPDGLIGEDGILEIKCPYWRQTPHDEVPADYYIQMLVNMAVTGRKYCDFVSWTMEGMAVHRVEGFDKDLFNCLLEPWSKVYVAMQCRGELKPLSKEQQQQIDQWVRRSMKDHIRYDTYTGVEPFCKRAKLESSDAEDEDGTSELQRVQLQEQLSAEPGAVAGGPLCATQCADGAVER